MVKWGLVLAAIAMPLAAHAQTPAPSDAVVYIISPRDGQRVKSPFTVQFGLRGMGVTRAGDATANMGHHHLLIDVEEPVNPKEPLPNNRKHLHFGAGQTETQLDLPPGKHSLQLVLGDTEHRPFNPIIASAKTSVTVIDPNAPQLVRKKKRQRVRQPRR